MIKFQKKISPDISIAIWQIEEIEDFFWNLLHLLDKDAKKIKNISLEKVRLQKLACRAALAQLVGCNEIEITYSENGQPQLKEHYISFSHTKNTVAVALANIPVGIDIEKLTPRILPLYPRFMNNDEIKDCDTHNLQELYYYWCAKEAMFKWMAIKNLDFIKDLRVYKNENKGVVFQTKTIQLSHFYIDGKIIVVCY